MAAKYVGGCEHVKVSADAEPYDNHECHCNVCKDVTGQQSTHCAFFRYADVTVDHPERMTRMPYNKDNPDGPLELCVCAECGSPLMVDDRQRRIRVEVPNLMGFDDANFPKVTYHAFWDETKGYAKPDDGLPVYDGLKPDFVWPAPA